MYPDVSVLMPVWNGCKNGSDYFLRAAMDSILNQTFQSWEMVIIDDGSTDRTSQVLASYMEMDSRVRMFRDEHNMGIVHALNRGLAECKAPLVARQDADDASTVTRLELQKKFLDDRPETVMCGTGMYVINEEGKLVMEVNNRPCRYDLLKAGLRDGCLVVHGSVMFRKDVILKAGGYSPDPRFQHAEDYELWVRLAKDHVIENMPGKTLYFHRNHAQKIGEIYKQQQETATRLIMEIARQTLSNDRNP